jgi:hypothetical protein
VTVVVISSGEEGDRLVGSLQVKVPMAGRRMTASESNRGLTLNQISNLLLKRKKTERVEINPLCLNYSRSLTVI